MTEQTQARELFRAAYENRYTWDENFPGYTADIQLKRNDQVYSGQVRINRDLSYEIVSVSDEGVRDLLQSQLWETVTHRKRNSFEQAHGKNSFSLGAEDETGAIEILVTGDAMGSNYKVRNNEISQVSRVFPGRVAFVIEHRDSLNTGAGYISTDYDVVYRNPESGEIVRQDAVKNFYEVFGAHYLMVRQVIESIEQEQKTVTETSFSNIQLLQPATV